MFNEVANDKDFAKLKGKSKKGDWTTSNSVIQNKTTLGGKDYSLKYLSLGI